MITGLTYSTGIEYQINPRFKLGLLFSVAGGEELGQHHMYWDEASQSALPANRSKILLFSSYFDLIKSRYLDLLLGAALGIANVNTLRETSDRGGLRLFATPAFSAGIRY